MAPRVGVTNKWDQCGWADLRVVGKEIWTVIQMWPFHYTDGLIPALYVDMKTRVAVEVRVDWNMPRHRRTKPIRIHHENRPRTLKEIAHVKSLDWHGSRKWNYPKKWRGKKKRRSQRVADRFY